MELLKPPHFNLIINVSDEERQSEQASERKVKRRVNETIACAHTAHANTLQSIYFSWHFTCSMLIHLWMGAASMNYRFFFPLFSLFSFTDWGGAFTHYMRIWLFAWFIFFFFFFGCGNCDLTKNRKYANHFSIVFINMCVSCLAHIQYIIEFV